ncbi:hypothetical protein KI387_001043, partial [Taxus chinensis]
LNKLGGLSAVVRELYRAEEELRTIAAWVLGKASQNNPIVQKQILEIGVLPKLIRMVKSSCSEEAVKALYAVSAVIRNNLDGQAVFYMEGGSLMLRDLMRNSSSDLRLHRKSLFLVADLAEHGLETGSSVSSSQTDTEHLKAVVDLLAVPDLDMQEKVEVLENRAPVFLILQTNKYRFAKPCLAFFNYLNELALGSSESGWIEVKQRKEWRKLLSSRHITLRK